MLIDLTFKNFKPYRDETEFSMVADKYKRHWTSLMRIPGQRSAKVLPVAAIYGANASGKSAFVIALKALQHTVLTGKTEMIEPFLLDAKHVREATEFCIRFIEADQVFEYSLRVQEGNVIYEELQNQTKAKPVCLYKRVPGKELVSDVLPKLREGERVYVEQLGRTLPKAEVLLTTLNRLRPEEFYGKFVALAYTWFALTVCIIGADSRRVALGLDLLNGLDKYEKALNNADTGIEKLEFKSVEVAAVAPPDVVEAFKNAPENMMISPVDGSVILFKNEKGVQALRCFSLHHAGAKKIVDFPLTMESDGTRRYMHLLPIILDVERQRVYVVDELDRCLHHQLSLSLIERCRELISSQEQKLQLIFTTHDALLMAKDNLRKDEVWVMERDSSRATHLVSFNDYENVRSDCNIMKSYLEGRMGGLPKLYPVS